MIDMVNINNIKPNPKNPRVIKDDKFKKLVTSIKEFPEMLEKRPPMKPIPLFAYQIGNSSKQGDFEGI